MARPRSVPDTVVHQAVLALIRTGGEKAVTFSAVAARAGLAASSLAERHGSVAGMIADARKGAWDEIEAATAAALAEAPMTAKGAIGLLKALSAQGPAPVAADPARAAEWRRSIESGLAARLGDGPKGREAAAILFAFWQGQLAWDAAGPKTARLKDALRRLGA
ncbi:MAG: transcriptional regulator [Gemmobacter sp.]|uniref:transcriptional regulator n=1 Tax=Gemmobacter sp. TaxID=1898957 RepID=UPI00391A797F